MKNSLAYKLVFLLKKELAEKEKKIKNQCGYAIRHFNKAIQNDEGPQNFENVRNWCEKINTNISQYENILEMKTKIDTILPQ